MTTAQQMRDCIATAVLALPRTARVPAAATAVLRLLMLALRELMPLFGKEWAIELLRTLLSQMQQLQAQGGVGLLSIEQSVEGLSKADGVADSRFCARFFTA